MKFCKTYQNHMKERAEKLPEIGFKSLKKTLKKCRSTPQFQNAPVTLPSSCPLACPACDGTFFTSLLDEMSAVVDCFNLQAQKLLYPPLEDVGICKYYFLGRKYKEARKQDAALVKAGENLLIYAMVNAIAFRKILKKYDKVHHCEKGRAFKSGAQAKNIEILHSPWLYELMAFHMNLRDRKLKAGDSTEELFQGLAFAFNEDTPSMTCELYDSVKIDVDLTCPICLDIVFDAMALACGHILCYVCACSAASVTIVDGIKAADPREKCPLCRKAGVYGGAIHLEELNIWLSKRCPEYWKKRIESERLERLRLVKEHWQSQYRAFVGV